MKKGFIFIPILGLCFWLIFNNQNEPQGITQNRIESSLNADWLFKMEGEIGNWDSINLPHTPRIEPLVVNDQWQGEMWYQKTLLINDDSKRYFLEFEGVMTECEVWLNEISLGTHQGGYLPFIFDITERLNYNAENNLKVYVKNEDNADVPPGKSLETLDFNTYGGIYRSVNLIATNTLHITHPLEIENTMGGGIIAHFEEVNPEAAKGSIRVSVKNSGNESTIAKLNLTLTDASGTSHVFLSDEITLETGSAQTMNIPVEIKYPKLWSTSVPELYTMDVAVYQDNLKVDAQSIKIGIRDIELSADGFFLNGEKIYIRGTNRHQEYPYIGYALSKNANYRDAVMIKQAGFDFVRLSHYPQDESFLNACDELGILVMDAIPGWQFIGGETFVKNSFQNIREVARVDRNHPSVVFWEVSLNESGMDDTYMKEANRILREELPFDDTYTAGWIDHPAYDLYIPARQHGKAPDYWKDYKDNSRPLFIAEYGDWEYYAQNAGFDQKSFKDLKEDERTSRQLRTHGEKRLLQQAFNFQEAANSNRRASNTIGHANWLMFDYNRGYAPDIESSGISDIFRIPKFAYYFYQSQRPPADTLALKDGTGPMVKIASFWEKDANLNLRIYSNCEEVALYVNDRLAERKMATKDKYSDELAFPPFQFDLGKYENSTLKAIGYIAGMEVALDVVNTPLEPTAVRVKLENNYSKAPDTNDVIFVYAQITDTNGTIVPSATGAIQFDLEGTGELIGENPVRAEAGIATVLFRGDPSTVQISARMVEME